MCLFMYMLYTFSCKRIGIYLHKFTFLPSPCGKQKTPEAQLSRASCPGVGAEMEIRRREGLGKERSG